MQTRFKKGFTLIELLVVIAIIGLLSSVVLASLNTARSKADDAARYSDLQSLQQALELYYSNHGSYPPYDGGTSSVTNSLGVLVTDGDISQLPTDPQPATHNGGSTTWFRYCSDANDYALLAYPEKTNYWCQISDGADPCTWSVAFPHCGS